MRPVTLLAAALLLSASACSAPPAAIDNSAIVAIEADASTNTNAEMNVGLAPIRDFLACLPREAALMTAHRGTGDNLGAPENSISGLKALITRGVLMAEVDIAKIKDGTLISYHDGVWEEKSSGRGPVVATTAAEFTRIRLREPSGTIGGEAVPTLAEMLDIAKDRIYLEVDFKTSADIPRVIEALRARDMVDQVVLIAITDEEADILRPYADEFVLSLPRSSALDNQGVWVGGGWRDGAIAGLKEGAILIGSQWRADGPDGAGPLDILVTDAITEFDPLGVKINHDAFKMCLSN